MSVKRYEWYETGKASLKQDGTQHQFVLASDYDALELAFRHMLRCKKQGYQSPAHGGGEQVTKL